MSIDEREDEDEEQEDIFEGMPFVISNDVVDNYGEEYSITLDKDGLPSVKNQI